MPLVRDKIIINSGLVTQNHAIQQGYTAAINQAYKDALTLADEMEDRDWLMEPDALDFLARQEKICQTYDNACDDHQSHQHMHIKAMRELIEDMRKWIDKKLLNP